jgi:hypothetical protein
MPKWMIDGLRLAYQKKDKAVIKWFMQEWFGRVNNG